jgi:hypothetical protein
MTTHSNPCCNQAESTTNADLENDEPVPEANSANRSERDNGGIYIE